MTLIIRLQAAILGVLVWAGGLLFLPLYVTDPFEYPKAMAFIVIVGLLTMLTLAHAISSEKSVSWKSFPLEVKLLFGVIAAQFLAFVFSTNSSISLLGAPFRFQGLIAQLTLAVYFLNVVYIFRYFRPNDSRKTFFVWLVGAGVVSALVSLTPFVVDYPFFDLEGFQNRVFGALGNPNYLAVYLTGIIPFLGLFFSHKSWWIRVVSVAALLLLLAVLFLTGSRSAWLSLVLGLFFVSILVVLKQKSWRMLVMILSVVVLLVGVFLFQRFYETDLLHRFSLTKDNVGSVSTRGYLQEAGLKLFLERPVFGTGQEMVIDHIEPYLPEYLKSNDIFYIDRTHNEFLDVLVMQGLVGFLAYILFWGILLWRACKYYLQSSGDGAFLFSIAAIVIIHLNYAMNFAVVSANILLYLFAGYVVALRNQAEKIANKNEIL